MSASSVYLLSLVFYFRVWYLSHCVNVSVCTYKYTHRVLHLLYCWVNRICLHIFNHSKDFISPLRHIFKPLLISPFEICSIRVDECVRRRTRKLVFTSTLWSVGKRRIVQLQHSRDGGESAYRSGRSSKWALKRPNLHIHLVEMWIVRPYYIYFAYFLLDILIR